MDKKNIFFQRLLVFTSIMLIFIVFTRPPIDADVWWHLRAGQTMIEQKHILLEDIYSYTRTGETWVNAFWVSEVVLYIFYSIGGYFGLTLFVSLIGAATFYLLSRRSNGNPFTNGLALILCALAAAPIWGPRPQIISFFIIALLDLWLSSKRPHWWLPILFAIWANIHGGWIWGFLLIAAHIAGNVITVVTEPEERSIIWKETRSLIFWTVISSLAIAINPNGISLWKLPFQQVDVSMQIQEWLSPDFHRIDFHPFLWVLFLLLLLSPFAPKRPAWGQIIKVLGFSYLTFVAQRNIAVAAIVASPLLADWMNSALQRFTTEKKLTSQSNLPISIRVILNTVLIISLFAASLGNVYLSSLPEKVDKNYPVEATEWIKLNHPQGKLFNSYNWGGYLLWTLPEYPVFIDGRADLYGNELLAQWQDVINARENAEAILDDWRVNIIFVEPYWDIVPVLKDKGWTVAYEDAISIILIRP